jgi:hypothetical protein
MTFCNDPHHDHESVEELAPESGLVILLSVFLFFALFCLGIGIRDYFKFEKTSYARFNLYLSIISAVLIVYYGFCCGSEAHAIYEVHPNGVLIKYPFRKPALLKWDVFQEICICYSDITTRGPLRYNTVICCVRHGERRNFYDRWKTNNAFRYKSVISIAYSDSRLSELQAVCPFRILDRRGRGGYHLR